MSKIDVLKAESHFSGRPPFCLSVVRIRNHAASHTLHRHEFHELVIISGGQGRHVTDSDSYAVQTGDVFMIRGETAHGYINTHKMSLANILFDPRQLRLPMNDIRNVPGYHALFRVEPMLRTSDRFQSALRLDMEQLSNVMTTVLLIEEELSGKRHGYRFMACSQLMNLLGYLSRAYSNELLPPGRPLMRIGELLSFMEENHAEQLSVEQLARRANMSPSTLTRTFRKITGHSPVDHLIRIRIGKALQLLNYEDASITEIAFMCGFQDSNYFSRTFRRIMGVTPREYRRQRRHVRM